MGFLKGVNVNIIRAIVVNAAELSAYDQSKLLLVNYGGMNPQSIITHFISSVCAGFFATICSSPFDVVKTRVMNQSRATATGSD